MTSLSLSFHLSFTFHTLPHTIPQYSTSPSPWCDFLQDLRSFGGGAHQTAEVVLRTSNVPKKRVPFLTEKDMQFAQEMGETGKSARFDIRSRTEHMQAMMHLSEHMKSSQIGVASLNDVRTAFATKTTILSFKASISWDMLSIVSLTSCAYQAHYSWKGFVRFFWDDRPSWKSWQILSTFLALVATFFLSYFTATALTTVMLKVKRASSKLQGIPEIKTNSQNPRQHWHFGKARLLPSFKAHVSECVQSSSTAKLSSIGA